MLLILSLICLFAPLPLWLVEVILPFPYIIEELFKFIIVKKINSTSFWAPLLLGLLFSISESVLYLTNFFQLGDFSLLPLRILLTTTLHCGLFLLQYSFRSHRYFSWLSLFLAILIHLLYNYLV